MIDMHMHTVYSDGDLREQDILARLLDAECMSVTDHNSVYMYRKIYESGLNDSRLADRLIVGSEITIESQPDCLLFFPFVSLYDIERIKCIEELLRKVRLSEEKAIQQAYEIMKETDTGVKYSDWSHDFFPMIPEVGYKLEARTRDLASMRYSLRCNSVEVGRFDREDLLVARSARRKVEYTVDFSPYQIALESKGEIVLAHPIKTAYIFSGREKSSLEAIQENLERIISGFYANGGRIIEWEYIDGSNGKNLIQTNKEELRKNLLEYINQYDLECVWGTDSHSKFPEDSKKWSLSTMKILGERLPEWARRRL